MTIRLTLTVHEVLVLRDALIHAQRGSQFNEPKFREYELLFKHLGDACLAHDMKRAKGSK